MPGGEMELTFIGAQDIYLVSNPQISFFKGVYKRYTNFSLEFIDLDDDSTFNTLSSFENDIILKYKIPRNGDCLKGVCLEFDLPDIYSSESKKFQWIKNFGEFIIKEVVIKGGDSRVYHRLTGEYIHIYNNIYYPKSKKHMLDILLGNTIDMYNPSLGGNNNGIYPASILPSLNNVNNINVPSITGRKIIIPIPFWFSHNLETTLPLISLQSMELRIEVTMRPLKEWYTVIDTYPLSITFNTRIRPKRTEDKLSNFTDVANLNLVNNNDLNNDILNSVSIRAKGEYIFMDNMERKELARSSVEFIIRQNQYYTNNITLNTGGNINLNLKDINHPVRKLWFMIRRKDNEFINDWSNFTFLDNESSPLQNNFISDSHHNYDYSNVNIIDSNLDFLRNNEGDIIKDVQLIFNGNPRFNVLPINYFKNYNFKSTPYTLKNKGIYCFAFDAKDNREYQPSGSCNFSTISKKELRLNLHNPSNINKLTGDINKQIGDYTIIIIAESFNIFKVNNGLAGLIYE
jgi:hypothetical protein